MALSRVYGLSLYDFNITQVSVKSINDKQNEYENVFLVLNGLRRKEETKEGKKDVCVVE